MSNKSFEQFMSTTACGQALVLEVFGEVGKVSKMTIGNRFFTSIKAYPAQCGYSNETVARIFDFYRNYAPLLDWEELKKGWECYQKAKQQRSDNLNSAFWNYFDGKRLKIIGRKGAVFEWV